MVERLSRNGFHLRQLKDFWLKYAQPVATSVKQHFFQGKPIQYRGQIHDKTTTNEVVRDIVLQESQGQGAYVNVLPGGPEKPDFLVSHWWGALFYHDALCIAEHAAKLTGRNLKVFTDHTYNPDITWCPEDDHLVLYFGFSMFLLEGPWEFLMLPEGTSAHRLVDQGMPA